MDNELELLGATTLNRLSRRSPFQVPAGYFDTLPDHILNTVQWSEAEEPFPAWSKNIPFEAPGPAYFEHFAAGVIARTQSTEQEHLLEELPKTVPFSAVPAGYFEQFSDNLLKHIQQETTVQAAPVKKRIPLFHNWQLAASVALIIFSGLGILQLNNNKVPVAALASANRQVNFTGISKDAISEYIDQNIDEFDTELIVSSFTESGTQIIPELNVSNTEIENYLDEDGWN